MASAISQWIGTLQEIGVFQYVLPFVLTFAIIYGILNKLSLLGNSKQGARLHTVVSAVISLFVTVYTPAGQSLSSIFTTYFGALSVVLVAIFGALILVGLVFGDDWDSFIKDDSDNVKTGVFVVLALIALAVFLGWGGLGYIFPGASIGMSVPSLSTTNMLGIVVVVATILFLVWALDLTGDEDNQ